MLIVLWTVKAGAGCTTATLGVALRRSRHESVLVVDLGGDVPAACGMAEPDVGVTDWLRAGATRPDALTRVEVGLAESLALLPTGSTSRWSNGSTDLLVGLLAHEDRCVVVDAGFVGDGAHGPMDMLRRRLIRAADRSVLVTRPCYLALRRVASCAEPIDSIVLVRDQMRSLGRADVADVVGVDDVHHLDVDPGIARSLDAGLVATRPPRLLLQQMKRVAA